MPVQVLPRQRSRTARFRPRNSHPIGLRRRFCRKDTAHSKRILETGRGTIPARFFSQSREPDPHHPFFKTTHETEELIALADAQGLIRGTPLEERLTKNSHSPSTPVAHLRFTNAVR